MTKPDSFNLQYYVVCVIDILGQKQKLADWGELPTEGALPPRLISALRGTVGTILGFRKTFEKYFSQIGQCTMPDEVASLSREDQLCLHRYKDCELKTQRFSDTFVFYAPLSNSFGDLSVLQIHQILGACSVAMLTSLAARIPVRGGIAIGAGIEIEDHSLYGPALAYSHSLESKAAKYPRVIVSPEVLHFLRTVEANAHAGEVEKMMSNMARECQKLLAEDADGKWIVDYMGRGVRETLPLDDMFQKEICDAYEFVCSEAERFKVAGDSKLAPRYANLQSYMESRLKLWTE